MIAILSPFDRRIGYPENRQYLWVTSCTGFHTMYPQRPHISIHRISFSGSQAGYMYQGVTSGSLSYFPRKLPNIFRYFKCKMEKWQDFSARLKLYIHFLVKVMLHLINVILIFMIRFSTHTHTHTHKTKKKQNKKQLRCPEKFLVTPGPPVNHTLGNLVTKWRKKLFMGNID